MFKKSDPRYPFLRFERGDINAKKDSAEYHNRIVSNDEEIDIFDIKEIPTDFRDLESKLFPVKDFSEYSKGVIYFDIETLGLDPTIPQNEIVAVGFKMNSEYRIAANPQKTEKQLLQWLLITLNQLRALGAHTIAGYNVYGFDFGFVQERLERYGLECPWKVNERYSPARWLNTSVAGSPLELTNWQSRTFELIDLYPEVAKDDFLTKRLDSYSLKNAVIGWGLRDDRRIEIGSEISDYWERAKSGDVGSLQTIKEYLAYDLDDSELIFNYTIPSSYYQKEFIDMPLQRHCCTGNGSKWNRLLMKEYPLESFEAEEKLHYRGGITGYKAGLYRNVSKVDVASLYPTVMLLYGICSWKDKDQHQLKWLAFLRDRRLRMKSLAGKWEKSPYYDQRTMLRVSSRDEADYKQASAKIFINSGYGFLGVTGCDMNDMYAAAAVCGYSRAVLNFMESFVESLGAKVIGKDTDSVVFYTESLDRNTEVYEALQAALPHGIEIEHEWIADAIFIPPSAEKIKRGAFYDGLSKNYIYFLSQHDLNGKSKGKVKMKGRFTKRDRSILDKTFQRDWIKKYLDEGFDSAEEFYQQILKQISDNDYPVENLKTRVLVRKGSKTLPSFGFTVGTKPNIHYTWLGEYSGVRVKKPVLVPTEDPNLDYYPPYYIDIVNTLHNELLSSLDEIKESAKTRQLSLV